MTQSFHGALNSKPGWESDVVLDSRARKELEFWKTNCLVLIQDPFTNGCAATYSNCIFAVGCTAFISIDNMPVAHKNWHSLSRDETKLHLEGTPLCQFCL